MEVGKFEQACEAEEVGYSLELVTHCAKFIGKAHKKQYLTFFLVHADSKEAGFDLGKYLYCQLFFLPQSRIGNTSMNTSYLYRIYNSKIPFRHGNIFTHL